MAELTLNERLGAASDPLWSGSQLANRKRADRLSQKLSLEPQQLSATVPSILKRCCSNVIDGSGEVASLL